MVVLHRMETVQLGNRWYVGLYGIVGGCRMSEFEIRSNLWAYLCSVGYSAYHVKELVKERVMEGAVTVKKSKCKVLLTWLSSHPIVLKEGS